MDHVAAGAIPVTLQYCLALLWIPVVQRHNVRHVSDSTFQCRLRGPTCQPFPFRKHGFSGIVSRAEGPGCLNLHTDRAN